MTDREELIRQHCDYCRWTAGGSVYASISEGEWLRLALERRRAELELAHHLYPQRFSARFGPRPNAVSDLGKEVQMAGLVATAQAI